MFYIIYSPQGHTPPKVQHPDAYAARREAERLARAHPEKEFYVMRAEARARTLHPPVQWTVF